jgi:hypothetical protein
VEGPETFGYTYVKEEMNEWIEVYLMTLNERQWTFTVGCERIMKSGELGAIANKVIVVWRD